MGTVPQGNAAPDAARRCPERGSWSKGRCWAAFQHCVSTPGTPFPQPGPCLPHLCLTHWFFLHSSQADLVFEYQPLKTGESTGRLVLQSSDLGSFYYDLHLKATMSRPEKPLYFCTTLGSRQTITTKIMNYAQQKTEYLLQVTPACPG